ncbi:MAG: PQQ-binding-like beta-propeller repeat protein, partial [Acidobacteria bacterium]|nr:PQQ-binding-like beta-propeller repeat protein [Acidobacteriota bacterium]
GLYPDNWTDRQARELPLLYPARPGTALSLYKLYERTNDNRWLDDANRYLEACEQELNANRFDRKDVSGWNSLAQAATEGYLLTGNAHHLELARRAAREGIARPQPKAQMASLPGISIHTLVLLYQATGEREWLEGARRIADYALGAFVHPSGLIRGTALVDRPDYYDAIQGPGTLALALYELGGVQEGASPIAPRKLEGDAVAPSISGWKFAEVNGNRRPIAVSVRIADPSGISRTALHYTYGTEIGFLDEHPQVNGDEYTFHAAPPGIAFSGFVSFAVEAVDASANHNRTITRWQQLKTATEERATGTEAGLRYPALGLTVRARESGEARMMTWLPSGVSAPAKGWVSIGRYFELAATQGAERLTVSYAPEETWRLIESTLALAFWDGHQWTRVPGELDSARRLVTAPFREARYWTVLGEDRVLWRAPGRETGVALAPVAADGTFEVLTTAWQPGELLSSRGEKLFNYPVDPPYHPVHNSSSPAVARLKAGAEPVLLIGAPSAYVYAYTRDGRRLWRTEVGGEILGAIAAGRLTASADLAVAGAWNGGVAVMDAGGRKLWEKALPKPSGGTPVLVDLDGDGRLEIVVNSGSRLVALRGDTGAVLWEFEAGGAGLVTPAAGALVRGGRPRLVTGDDSGAVYAVDEKGQLLWRQTRVFGPREVPEPIEYYAAISEIGLADLTGTGERQVVVATKAGETVALGARGERLWRFASYERKVGISLGGGARLAFADLDEDGQMEVILSQQDSFLYVLDSEGRQKWCYLGYFWYHTAPAVADLQHTGELNIVFTAPEDNGTYALRGGHRGKPGRAPWPMARGGLERTNCAPW